MNSPVRGTVVNTRSILNQGSVTQMVKRLIDLEARCLKLEDRVSKLDGKKPEKREPVAAAVAA